jgi:hypothetical protein
MSRADSVFLVVCVALVACAAAFHWYPKGPRYFPRQHTWRTRKIKGKPSMGWYWRSGWAFGVSVVAAGAAAAGLKWMAGAADEGTGQPSLPGYAYALATLIALGALTAVSVELVDHYFTHWGTWGPWTIPST